MRIVTRSEILAVLDETAALAAVEAGFRAYSVGKAQLMAVGHLGFTDPPGDCHLKGAYAQGDEVFVIKLASSFYRNPDIGLPSSNGFMVVVSARTGEVLALLHDEGALTDQRTAMAGAIAARAILRAGSKVLGIVGTGTQARLQAKLISRLLGLRTILVWGRNQDRAAALATELGGQAMNLPDLCARADLIVTTTPSTQPLLTVDMIRPGTRIVAVGADCPGKQELDPQLLAKARILVDSRSQCVDHGDTGWAVRAGLVDATSLLELGTYLEHPIQFASADIVVADLTGVAIQDVAIAKSVWQRLASTPHH
jgi:ornithine cyclodeaminase